MGLTRGLVLCVCLATLAAACGKDVAEVSAADTESFGSVEEVVEAVRGAGVSCTPEPIVGEAGKKISGTVGMAAEGYAVCDGLTIESIFKPNVIVEGKTLSPQDMRAFFSGDEAEARFRQQARDTFAYITDRSDFGICLLLGRNWVMRMSYDPDSDEDGARIDALAAKLHPYVECVGDRPPKGW